MNKNIFFKIIFAIWLVLWLFFLVREDKKGQYELLARSIGASAEEKTALVYGREFYDFLVYCRRIMPPGSSYELAGFEKYSIDEVRARYFLYPLVCKGEKADFRIVYGGPGRYSIEMVGGDK